MKINAIKAGFTLAEVLITLGIIGIVAALTIPTLMQKMDERVQIVALKRTYSLLTQAYKMSEIDNGTPQSWGLTSSDSVIIDKIKPYLKVAKDCSDGSQGCWPAGVSYDYVTDSFNQWGGYGVIDGNGQPKLRLVDGTLIYGYPTSEDCSISLGDAPVDYTCGVYGVDTNGAKRPNRLARDMFFFRLTKTGIVPYGTRQEWVPGENFTTNCKQMGNTTGLSCAAWVIYNDNMDYLRCADLSWLDKTKCSP